MKLLSLSALSLLLIFLSGTASFAQDNEAIIKYRQNVMSNLSNNMKMLKAVVTGKVANNDHLLPIANNFTNTAKLMHGTFPEGSDFGETDAKAEIWENMDDFKLKISEFEKATQDLLTVAKESNNKSVLMDKFKAIGQGCKSCHKKYREK